jgi:hypothetical protein
MNSHKITYSEMFQNEHELDPSCNKYSDLIGQEQVSIPHINLI